MVYGVKYFKFAPFSGTEPTSALPNYGSAIELAELAKLTVTPAYNNVKAYGGNKLVHNITEFKEGAVDTEITNLTNAQAVSVYGITADGNDLAESGDEIAPFGGAVAITSRKLNDGSSVFQALFFPKVQANKPGAEDYTTKGENLVLVNDKLSFTAFKPNFGKWRYKSEEFTTEAAAQAWCDAKLGTATYYKVDVQVNGASSSEGASPAGRTLVKSGESFVLTLTGTPTAIYDNGTDSVASVSDGKYTIASIAADHTLSVIF